MRGAIRCEWAGVSVTSQASPSRSGQPSISASMQNVDIRKSNNATLEMAIAIFFILKIFPTLLLNCQHLSVS
jgi:hypothetical protein